MTESAEVFRRAIALTEVPAQVFDRAFTAEAQYVPWPKAYGGDMVAQAVVAATATIEQDRTLHSLHNTFLRPVDVGLEVRYEVELLRDGRGYSTRQVRAFQNDKAVFLSTASFQVPENGPTHAPPSPETPAPESLPSSAEYLRDAHDDAAAYWAYGRSFDHRHVPGPLYLRLEGEATPYQAVWVRAFERLPDDPALHRAAIAYVCDYTILEPSLRVLGLHWSSPGLRTASLDHAMWFHRDARADDWLLYVQEVGGVQSGRGLNFGRFFDRDGVLVASVAQEGMIRAPGSA
ncbi:acyl-CoA thioesterase [Glaciibacter superstes]|uniref:acyl-CoA thioesterase n=1 Tax=Glaciibacter superstes TaxID=501023 RepID=UPI0003B45F12|nr:acyl-CoA thioesterase domain-containing protein [Glaciibacter superstes]